MLSSQYEIDLQIKSSINSAHLRERERERETALKYKTFKDTNSDLNLDYKVLIKSLGILDQFIV
jgi:hypothetical protein